VPSRPQPRILVLSSRPDVLAAVTEAAAGLEPVPVISHLLGHPEPLTSADLVLADVGEPAATSGFLRARLGPEARYVAVLDTAWVDRFGDALAGEWFDYLFYPISPPELGLVWRRHTTRDETRSLTLDVTDDGRIHLTLPSLVSYQRPAVERIVEAGRHLAGLDAETAFRVRVAVGEAVANAILYGSGQDAGRIVQLDAQALDESYVVTVRDEGEGFDPGQVPDPTTSEGIARPSGRGLLLMRRWCDALSFNDRGNEVTLSFRGAFHPARRIAPLLSPFEDVTGLRFRVDLDRFGTTETLHDAWADERAAAPAEDDIVLREHAIGPEEWLRIAYPRGASQAGDLLDGLLGLIADRDEARERWVERRLRRERVLAELEVARDLQLRLLPDPARFADLAEVAARCEPALSLGGDFYFLSRLAGGRLGIMLGDVSSHGPSAALIMALTLSAAALVARGEAGASEVLDGMREQMLGALETTEMYMTLFYAVVDPGKGILTYANAGHPHAHRVGTSGISRLAALDPPIGMAARPGFGEASVAWPHHTDTLIAFTDGLTEDLVDPLAVPESAVCRRIAAGQLDPRGLVDALFEDQPDDLRLDDRTAVAVRP